MSGRVLSATGIPISTGCFWRIVEHHAVATLSGVPTVYAALAQVPVDADISGLQSAAVGASPLPSLVREAFRACSGVELAEGYGLTEATCASARQFPGQSRTGSVGQRLPYQLVKAVGPGPSGSRADLAPGEPGLLVVHGPSVFAGVRHQPRRRRPARLAEALGTASRGGTIARKDDCEARCRDCRPAPALRAAAASNAGGRFGISPGIPCGNVTRA